MIRHERGKTPEPGPSYFLYLNAILLETQLSRVAKLANLPIVKEIWDGQQPIRVPKPVGETDATSPPQLGSFHRASYDWENVTSNNWGFSNIGGNAVSIPRSGWNGLRIAVIDYGFDEQHPVTNYGPDSETFINGKFNIWAVSYYITDFDNWDDQNGHGTNDAGCVWQFSPNAWYYILEAPSFMYQVVQSFDTAKSWGVDIITTSLGPPPSEGSCPCDTSHGLAVAAANAADSATLVVSAAGNWGSGDEYPIVPGCISEAVPVASINSSNTIASSCSPYYSCGGKPDLAAPGYGVHTLAPVEQGYTETVYGSSFAAPHVAGAAALLMNLADLEYSSTKATQTKNALYTSAIDLGDSRNRDGDGRALLVGALGYLRGNDYYPNPIVTIENQGFDGTRITFQVRLANSGDYSYSKSGVYLEVANGTFYSASSGGFDDVVGYEPGTGGWETPVVRPVNGARVIELYLDNDDEALSGTIRVTPSGSVASTTIHYRGWIEDRWDRAYNKYGALYDPYCARYPEEYPELEEGEVESGSSTNPPYGRHIYDGSFAFVDYDTIPFYPETVPEPPTLVSPQNNSTANTTTPLFEWNSVSNADYYGLYISEPPYGPNHLVFDSQEDYGPIYGTSFILPSGKLNDGIKYYWNMRAHNSIGWGEDFSDSWCFTVEINQPPTLSNGYVAPSSGNTSTTFNYYVTYTDPDGDAPTVKRVWIDEVPHTMTRISGDYTSGATFKYSTTLPAGNHYYSFDFNDGHDHSVQLPPSGTYSGPNVQDTGSLRVTISPQGAINAGAKWQVIDSNGNTHGWYDSGHTQSGLPVGSYTVKYKDISG